MLRLLGLFVTYLLSRLVVYLVWSCVVVVYRVNTSTGNDGQGVHCLTVVVTHIPWWSDWSTMTKHGAWGKDGAKRAHWINLLCQVVRLTPALFLAMHNCDLVDPHGNLIILVWSVIYFQCVKFRVIPSGPHLPAVVQDIIKPYNCVHGCWCSWKYTYLPWRSSTFQMIILPPNVVRGGHRNGLVHLIGALSGRSYLSQSLEISAYFAI